MKCEGWGEGRGVKGGEGKWATAREERGFAYTIRPSATI